MTAPDAQDLALLRHLLDGVSRSVDSRELEQIHDLGLDYENAVDLRRVVSLSVSCPVRVGHDLDDEHASLNIAVVLMHRERSADYMSVSEELDVLVVDVHTWEVEPKREEERRDMGGNDPGTPEHRQRTFRISYEEAWS